MSNILKRPMFKRGGTPNTGIMDGFNDGGRVGFQGGGSDIRRQMLQFGEREEQQPTATQQQQKPVASGLEGRPKAQSMNIQPHEHSWLPITHQLYTRVTR